MISHEEARARVAKGAAWLDAKWPEWANHVNTNTLDMAESCSCVLGQLTGDYNEAIGKLWPENFFQRASGAVLRRDSRPDTVALDLGFDAPRSVLAKERDVDFVRLQDAWIEAIADRRIGGVTVDDSHRVVDSACCSRSKRPRAR